MTKAVSSIFGAGGSVSCLCNDIVLRFFMARVLALGSFLPLTPK